MVQMNIIKMNEKESGILRLKNKTTKGNMEEELQRIPFVQKYKYLGI